MSTVKERLEAWISCFPDLAPKNLRCACGVRSARLKPIHRQFYAGLEAAECACGLPGKMIWAHKTREGTILYLRHLGLAIGSRQSMWGEKAG